MNPGWLVHCNYVMNHPVQIYTHPLLPTSTIWRWLIQLGILELPRKQCFHRFLKMVWHMKLCRLQEGDQHALLLSNKRLSKLLELKRLQILQTFLPSPCSKNATDDCKRVDVVFDRYDRLPMAGKRDKRVGIDKGPIRRIIDDDVPIYRPP